MACPRAPGREDTLENVKEGTQHNTSLQPDSFSSKEGVFSCPLLSKNKCDEVVIPLIMMSPDPSNHSYTPSRLS